MKTSNLIIDVNYNNGIAVRASLRVNKKGEGTVVTDVMHLDANKSAQENLFLAAAKVLGQLNETEFEGRVSLILPEAVSLRIMGANKAVKDGEDGVEKLYLGWMRDADEKSGSDYLGAITQFVEQLEAFHSVEGNSLNIVNARALYRYELNGEGLDSLKTGDTLKLANSINEEKNIVVTENNYLNGNFTVTTQVIRDRQGNSRTRAFVNRLYRVTEKGDTESKLLTASELLNLLDEKPDVELSGSTENTNASITALKLRKINAEKLPRVIVAKVTKVESATESNLF